MQYSVHVYIVSAHSLLLLLLLRLLEKDRKSHTVIGRSSSFRSISDSDSVNSLRTGVRVYKCMGNVITGMGSQGMKSWEYEDRKMKLVMLVHTCLYTVYIYVWLECVILWEGILFLFRKCKGTKCLWFV